MTPPTPTHTHIWDGSRALPDWLTGHRWHDEQLVIRTPDGDTRPHAGWWLIAWSDGTITAASPTSGERVYGADGMADRLARAEAALARVHAKLDEIADFANRLDTSDTVPYHDAVDSIRATLDARPAGDATSAEPEPHVYLSTGCWHGDHAYCQSMTGLNGAKRPGECKFCQASCRCGCHATAEQPGPLTPAGEARLAQDGIDTPGCDCGHHGMGVSWHSDDCLWRRSVVDCPGRPTPG